MIIDREDIERAKEKLGDENAFLMADILELDSFDEKNLKACCPYHDEDTPSFIYDKKTKRFHCFGCQKTVDIVDVLMEKGMTFLDAAKFVFEKADIEYAFGEQNVKTKTEYRYPHEEPLNERCNVLDYLGKRKISARVIDYLDIREDEYGNMVFNYYDLNDVLTMVKYRPSKTIDKSSGQPKCWCQKNSDTAPLLFNMNRINTSKPLLICEGEIDCASAIEAGYHNTVSVPLGAGNLHWIEENWDWLDQFTEIIIWSDNDQPGIKMRKECFYRLGAWRTKYIETPSHFIKENGMKIPLKDINDCLQIGGKEFVMSLISGAKDIPVKSVVDYSDVEEIDITQMDGIKTGIKQIDEELIKLFYGTLTVLSGRPGSGKTSLIDQIVASALDDDVPVFMFSREIPERMMANWMNTILAGRRNMIEKTSSDGRKYHVVPYNVQKDIQNFYKEKLFIYRDSEPNDIESIMKSAEDCTRKYGTKLIILDNLMMLDLHCSEADKNTAQTNLINDLIKFAAKFNIAVILVAHPKKTPEMNSDVQMYDIAGSSNIINLAMRSIGLRRTSQREKEDSNSKWGEYDVVTTIIKDRILGRADSQIGMYYDITSRRFYTNYSEYDHRYKWDTKEYLSKLPYTKRSRNAEEFPDK